MDTPLRILVAEDELGDVLLLQDAFEQAGVNVPVHFARDGQEVLDYLEGKPPFENPVEYPLPDLLLLDLGLPMVDGFAILGWLREHPRLRRLPVVVFSGSDRPEDIERAYALGAGSYLVKPREARQLVRVVGELQRYWRSINSPSEERPVPSVPVPA